MPTTFSTENSLDESSGGSGQNEEQFSGDVALRTEVALVVLMLIFRMGGRRKYCQGKLSGECAAQLGASLMAE